MRYWLGKAFLWLIGWRAVGEVPTVAKYVIVTAPHTSNWDAPIMLAITSALRLRMRWTVKHTWLRTPLGPLLRATGALAIDRRSRHDIVHQLVEAFENSDQLQLLITPEGTRSYTEYWKSGFYHIALGAGVPMVLAIVDYKHKRGGLGPMVMPSGDVKKDMDILRRHFAKAHAKFPEFEGPVRLKMEDDVSPTE